MLSGSNWKDLISNDEFVVKWLAIGIGCVNTDEVEHSGAALERDIGQLSQACRFQDDIHYPETRREIRPRYPEYVNVRIRA